MTATLAPFRTERGLILFVLLALAAGGWALVGWQAAAMDRSDHMMGLDFTMGMAAPLFLAMWVAMMVAMMFPAAAPMVVAFTRSQSHKPTGVGPIPVWLFVAPYLALWTVFGVAAYGVAVGVDALADDSMWAMDNLPRIAGALLITAGLYQVTPLKRVCLTRCRTPLTFMLQYWRDGRGGAVRMGLRHGLFCLGCCWVLFVVLLPLGVMNVGAMLAVAALVFAEKALPRGEMVAAVAAVVLVSYGAVAVVQPDVLPTAM